jgi:hypothetical protein
MALPVVGAFSELWPYWRGAELPSIHDAVSEHAEPDEEQLEQYLYDGDRLIVFMGGSEDVLGSGEQIFGGYNVMTDGTWVWLGSMCFYLRRYHVRLPSDFLAAVRTADYRRSEVARRRRRALLDEVKPLLG